MYVRAVKVVSNWAIGNLLIISAPVDVMQRIFTKLNHHKNSQGTIEELVFVVAI